eukprot:m.161628 g.161628  ORF g.161628 m.161628 type:complete len:323 (-) comp53042_c0_seq1:54-1022(-)
MPTRTTQGVRRAKREITRERNQDNRNRLGSSSQSLVEVGDDNLALEVLHGDVHVTAGRCQENELVGLVHLLETNPVLSVDGLLEHRQNLLHVANFVVAEPLALAGHDSNVLLPHDHDEFVEGDEVLLVCCVLLRALIVDVGKELVHLKVLLIVEGSTEVLSLDLHITHTGSVHTVGEQLVNHLADGHVEAETVRNVGHAHVLSAEGDEIVDGRGVAALDKCAQKLAALREPNSVESILQVRVLAQLLADKLDLSVNVANEAVQLIVSRRVANFNTVDINAWEGGFDFRLDSAHAFGIAARITHSMPEDDGALGGRADCSACS